MGGNFCLHSSIDMFTVIEAITILSSPTPPRLEVIILARLSGNNSIIIFRLSSGLRRGSSFLIKKVLISHAKLKFPASPAPVNI